MFPSSKSCLATGSQDNKTLQRNSTTRTFSPEETEQHSNRQAEAPRGAPEDTCSVCEASYRGPQEPKGPSKHQESEVGEEEGEGC